MPQWCCLGKAYGHCDLLNKFHEMHPYILYRRRLPYAILPPQPEISNRISFGWVFLALLFAFGLMTVIFCNKRDPRAVISVYDLVAMVIYRMYPKNSNEASYSQFTSHHPILTRQVSSSALKVILKNRLRVSGITINSSLVAACSDSRPISSRVLSSWTNVRGLRQVLVIHFVSSAKEIHQALRLVDSTDNPSRVIYIAVNKKRDSMGHPPRSATPYAQIHWPHSRAYNLGAKLASGRNLLFVDCRTAVPPNAISAHPIRNGSVYVRIGETSPDGSGIRPVQMVYVQRKTFFAVHGMDERIDLPGFEMADFIERVTRKTSQAWQYMRSQSPGHFTSQDASLVVDIPKEKNENHMLSSYPELAVYVSVISLSKMLPWAGVHINGEPSMLSLKPVSFRMLRSQSDPFDKAHHVLFLFRPSRRVDFRFWIRATILDYSPESLVNMLPRSIRTSVLLQAHRKLLHDHYGFPWKLLDMIETLETSVTNGSIDGISKFKESGYYMFHELNESSNSEKYSVALLKTWSYAPILFDIIWRKEKMLVVNIEADTAMELVRSVTWAITLTVAYNRALVLVGDLRGTALIHLLDVENMRRVLKNEYHINVGILVREHRMDCNTGGPMLPCWSDDEVGTLWIEKKIQNGISDLVDNPAFHLLVHITAKDVLSWDDRHTTSAWLRQIGKHAFACICVSEPVWHIINEGPNSSHDFGKQIAIWVTRSNSDRRAVRKLVEQYKKFLHEPESIKSQLVAILSKDSHFGKEDSFRERKLDAYQRMADLLMAFQSGRVVFDNDTIPATWVGVEEGLAEWRRVRGLSDSADESGIVHKCSSDTPGTEIKFHEMILNGKAETSRDIVEHTMTRPP